MPLKFFLLFIFLGSGFNIQAQEDAEALKNEKQAPEVFREFRAAWVATVANINWPSKPGLPVKEQKKEALRILDSLASLNFNAVIFQARPQGDAFYDSEIEPWSYFLTGKQGQAPDPYYDPLKFWIDEAHKRGMELHAWLNPYRIHHKEAPKPGKQSMVHQMEESAIHLKEGYWWLDPSKKSTQDHTLGIVKDLLVRYDIDGIHFDDYFYPYESYNGGDDFPDDESWANYQNSGGLLSRNAWRRHAVNQLVRRVYYRIKSYKPYVKFGISPFGIWRPHHPQSIEGMDQYDKLYADAKKWLNYGWVDYLSPQLYWTIQSENQSYPTLLQWWQKQNTHDRFLWPGINDYNATEDARGADEIHDQIMINRGIANQHPGEIHWSVAAVLENDTLQNRLKKEVYPQQALIPEMGRLAKKPILPKPSISKCQSSGNEVQIQWNDLGSTNSNFTVLQAKYEDHWETKILGKHHNTLPKTKRGRTLNKISLRFLDRYGRLGAPLREKIE